jgi:hypothetical protein
LELAIADCAAISVGAMRAELEYELALESEETDAAQGLDVGWCDPLGFADHGHDGDTDLVLPRLAQRTSDGQ